MLGLSRKAKVADAPADSTLPADVQIALESVSILVRPSNDDEGAPRIFVNWMGTGSFLYADDKPAQAVAKAFPELNDAQIKRACRALAGLVKKYMAEPSPHNEQPRRNWVMEW